MLSQSFRMDSIFRTFSSQSLSNLESTAAFILRDTCAVESRFEVTIHISKTIAQIVDSFDARCISLKLSLLPSKSSLLIFFFRSFGIFSRIILTVPSLKILFLRTFSFCRFLLTEIYSISYLYITLIVYKIPVLLGKF